MSCTADRTTNSNRAEQAAAIISGTETSVSPLNDMNRSVGPAPFRQALRQAQGPEQRRGTQGPERACGEPVEPFEGLAAGPRFARQMVRRQAATLRPTLEKRRWRCSHGRQRVGPELALRSLALAATPWAGFLPSRAKPRIAYMAPSIRMSSPGVRGLVSVAQCS